MINEQAYALGANRSVIRELFEYGRQRAAVVGPENVFDFSLGNPSIPHMINEQAYALGANRSVIRELFEYGRQRAAVVGPENVFDFSLGNPSIPAPSEVNQAIRDILADTDSLQLHGYTPAVGDEAARLAISQDLNRRYHADTRPEEFFLGCGAAPELVSVFRALAVPEGEILAIARI